MSVVKRVLISVSNKQGLHRFARGLRDLGVEIISTGGTARSLKETGISVREISEVTGFPEILTAGSRHFILMFTEDCCQTAGNVEHDVSWK